MLTFKKLTLISSFVLATTMSSASIAGHSLNDDHGDINAGKEKSAVCSGCHGVTGTSVAPMFPNLAGQKKGYIRKALKDFRSGNRKNSFMTSIAAELSDEDIDNLAAYFSAQ